MKGRRGAVFIAIALLNFLFISPTEPLHAQGRASSHRGAVLAVAQGTSGERILSVGEDGFLVEWDRERGEAAARFQLSPYAAQSLALSPNEKDIAVVETDDLGLYRVSAWNLDPRHKLFTLRFKDRVSYISYSASGSFLIVARDARDGISLIDAKTGELLPAPSDLSGPISFAATGKSERTMIAYSSVGFLSYWDVGSSVELKRVDAPASLTSPTLFGNNRYFGGLDERGLVIIDAITGQILARKEVSHGAFAVSPSESATSILAIAVDGAAISLHELSVPTGEPISAADRTRRINLPAPVGTVAASGAELLVGMNDGKVALINTESGDLRAYTARRRLRLSDAAVSNGVLLALSDRGHFLIPAAPENFENNTTLSMLSGQGEDRVLALSPNSDGADRFLLWRADASIRPMLYGRTWSGRSLDVPIGVPYRSVSANGNRILFLDATGAITIVSFSTGKTDFSFSSIGILDAVLSEDGRVFAGKSRAVAPKVPLLSIDSRTGETVPIDIRGTAVVRLHRGASGTVYAIIADSDSSGPKTSIVKLEFTDGRDVTPLVEYRSEDVGASIAESSASIATTLGGDGATLISSTLFTPFERTDALPLRLTSGDGYFIAVDSDGGLAWHDHVTGRVEAVLHLYEGSWEMERNGSRLSGSIR